jgi:branched-chain amino acid transport system substrate-binding protein
VSITRREFSLAAGAASASALGLGRPAIAQAAPIRIGWLAALTGPSSAPAIGFNRGVIYAAEVINATGA